MIPIKRLLYKIDFKLNKVATGKGQNISKADKLIALREAILRVIKKKVSVNNIFQLGFDSFQPRYEELQNLVVSYEEVAASKTDEVYTSYSIDLSSLKSKYFMLVDVVALGDSGACKDRVINVPRLVKHTELKALLKNDHYKPSFIFQEALATISGDKLLIYTEGFSISKVKISYLKYPQEVNLAGMRDLVTGVTAQADVDCDLNDILEDEILELAIMELALNTGNINAFQGSTEKSKNSEL